MNQKNYKTLIPALVGYALLSYEAITGHAITQALQSQIVNGAVLAVGLGFTLWGVWKSHKKAV